MKIAFLGDIAFVGRFDLSRNEKVSDNLEEIASFLRGFDYVIANLESPLTDKPTSSMCKAIHLKADPVNIDLLKRLNVKLVNLSNNHIFDYEVKGYRDTVRVLDENGIDYFGVDDRQFLLDFEGNRVAFSGYCCYSANGSRYKGEYDKDYITPVDSRVLESRLEEDQRNGCLSVLSIHWGIEKIHFPAAEHMRLARSLARTNRFILYGHHPHVAQGVENVNDAVVAYSLGNFMFDEVPSRVIKGLKNKMSPNNRESFILTVDISENRIVETGVVHFAETDGKITLRDNASFPDYCAHLKADPQTYEANRTEALKHLASDVAGRHDISWILKRLNYKFIGAYLKGRRNSKKYNRIFSQV